MKVYLTETAIAGACAEGERKLDNSEISQFAIETLNLCAP